MKDQIWKRVPRVELHEPGYQQPALHWFKRSDGVLYCVEEGSPEHTLMAKQPGTFGRCDEAGNLLPEIDA